MVVLLLNRFRRACSASVLAAGCACAGAAALLLCANDTNPFADLTNARAHITGLSFPTLAEHDSIQIYMRQTIDVVVALREEVDSIILVAPSNRTGDTIVLRPKDGGIFAAETYHLDFSLTDTGVKELGLYTCRSNGENVGEKMAVRVWSPLHQAPVSGILGDSVALSTPPVGDDDVWYCWSFGEYAVVKSTASSLRALLPPIAQAAGTGRLWVAGLRDSSSSGPVSFTFSLGDTSPPVIELAAGTQGVARNDTITTGDSIMAFRVRVSDQSSISYATVNGSDFTGKAGDVYGTTLRGLNVYTKTAPLTLKVAAADRGNHSAERTFWIVYDPTVPPGPGLAITLYAPPANPWVSGAEETAVVAAIEDLREDMLDVVVRVTVNDSAHVAERVTSGASSGVWGTRVRLGRYANAVAIAVSDTVHGDHLDTTITITYAPGSDDTIPPTIADLSVAGKKADGLCSARDTVSLRIIAFDQGQGIRTLQVNGTAAQPDSATPCVWYAPVALEHDTTRAFVTVQAIDMAGNGPVTQTIRMLRNRPPRVTVGIDPATPLRARQTLRFELGVTDDDHDPVSVEAAAVPAGMTVNGTIIEWTPADSQTGIRAVLLRLRDPYEATAYSVTLTVLPANPSPPVLQLLGPGGQALADRITLYDTAAPFIITVRIEDPDPPSVDRHRVTIDQGGGVTVTMLDTTRQFTLTVDPSRTVREYDTVRIIAVDVTDSTDTAVLVVRVLHYEPPVDTSGARLALATGSLGLSGDVIDFPLLVRFSAGMLGAVNPASAAGGLKFTKENGVELPYEIERWDTAGARVDLWILVDTVHAELDTQSILVDWAASPSPPNGAEVFDTANGFVGVWHLGASNTQGTHTDVTAHRFNGTSVGGYPSSATPVVAAGAIGQARQFDGINDRIDLGDQTAYQVGSYTFSCWINGGTSPQMPNLRKVFCKGAQDAEFDWSHTDNRYPQTHLMRTGTYPDAWIGARIPEWLPMYTWQYLCCTYTGSAISVFLNGAPRDTTAAPALRLPVGALSLGADPSLGAYYFSGLIDEFRFDNVARSDDWIRLCYETQKPGSGVVTFVSGGTALGPSFTLGDTARYVNVNGEDCVMHPNTLYGIRVTLDRTATIESMSTFPGYAGGPLRMGVYDATGASGSAGTLKAQTAEFSVSGAQVERWVTVPVVTPVQLAPGTYWLCLLTGSNPPTIGCPFNTAGPYVGAHVALTYGPLPATAPAMPIDAWDDSSYSLYATVH